MASSFVLCLVVYMLSDWLLPPIYARFRSLYRISSMHKARFLICQSSNLLFSISLESHDSQAITWDLQNIFSYCFLKFAVNSDWVPPIAGDDFPSAGLLLIQLNSNVVVWWLRSEIDCRAGFFAT